MNTGSPVQELYVTRIAQATENGLELYQYFDPTREGGNLDAANGWKDMPLGVLEAFAFYKLYVMDQDWGTVGVYAVDAYGTPTVVVWTHDDGGRCWLEIYGADGAFIASGRSANGKVAWRPRDEIRSHVFEEVILPLELLTPAEIEFWKNAGRL
jgi:hypothetical protein